MHCEYGKPVGRSLLIGVFLLLSGCHSPPETAPGKSSMTRGTPQHLPTISLRVFGADVTAQVARTPEQQDLGLMYRTHLGANDGMLFVFSSPSQTCFWMKNTLIPLSIAFINANGTLQSVQEMRAETLNNHCPSRPVSYALEMPAHWFSQKAMITGLPSP